MSEPAVNAVTPDGYLLDWVLLGPFLTEPPRPGGPEAPGLERDFLGPLGGEARAEIRPDAVVAYAAPGGRARTARARRVGPALDRPDRPDFRHILDGHHVLEQDFDQAVGYAFSYLDSPYDQAVYAYFASDGAAAIRLNGELVHAFPRQRKTSPWQDALVWRLRAGRNRLLVKVDNRTDWWGFQVAVFDAAHHLDGVRRAVRGLALEPQSAAAGSLALRVRLDPTPLEVRCPVEVRAETEDGRPLAAASGETGRPIALALPPGFSGPVQVRAETRDPRLPDIKGGALLFTGDLAGAMQDLRPRLAAASRDLAWLPAAWRGPHEGFAAWVEWALGRDRPEADWRAVRTWQYAASFIAALEAREPYAATHPGEPLGVCFAGACGTRGEPGLYFAFLPREFPRPDARYPLVVDLHGSNAGLRKVPLDKYNAPGVPVEDPPVVAIAPVTLLAGWDIAYLEAVLADAKRRFPVDADRVYLQGGSMGGKGTWDWAIARPELFAAACVKCGAEGRPASAARLRHVPVWVFNGEKDLASYPFMPELMVSAVRRAGGQARYTLFPDLAHAMGAAIDPAAVKAWYLEHRRMAAPAPADPLAIFDVRQTAIPQNSASHTPLACKKKVAATFFDDYQIAEEPAGRGLALTEEEDLAWPEDHLFRASVKLWQAYRKTAGAAPDRLADGQIMLRTVEAAAPANQGGAGRWRAILLAPLPFDAGRRGDLEIVNLPPMRAARVYARGTWEDLERLKRRVYADLESRGLRRTGEERAAILPTALKDPCRYWDLFIALA